MRTGWMWKSYPKEPTFIGGLAIGAILLVVYAGCYTVASLLGSLLQWVTGCETPGTVVHVLSVALAFLCYGIHYEITRIKDDDCQGIYSMVLGLCFVVFSVGVGIYDLL